MIHYSLRVALTTFLFAIFTLLVTDTLAATPPLDQPIPNPPSFPPTYHKSSTLSGIRRDTHDQRDNRRMEANKNAVTQLLDAFEHETARLLNRMRGVEMVVDSIVAGIGLADSKEMDSV
ncbi:hypothetical protein GT037_007412 [Alternaria burnsii]|uniref:Uncharacterized protein n=1 Tax=Alternaria burnsii TaxID=1187904 RepID=A0A8H7EG74_9PLEO|nr:uncharacterized protein GT037_007412 [Alternaria burnsii]KAF7674652.1 hypothetical protein GT037_007412 [Alternaria burnsii]